MTPLRTRPFLQNLLAYALLAAFLFGGGAWLVARLIVDDIPGRFRSNVFEFELPAGWTCVKEATESVCHKGKVPYAAVVILTMKERGPSDTMQRYVSHLSQAQGRSSGKDSWTSTVLGVETRRLGGHEWVIGRHFGSEIRNYYTDYYAALTSHKAILVTFSVHKSAQSAAQSEFSQMINTLKVYQQ
jgi:hypothetical protein